MAYDWWRLLWAIEPNKTQLVIDGVTYNVKECTQQFIHLAGWSEVHNIKDERRVSFYDNVFLPYQQGRVQLVNERQPNPEEEGD